MLPMSSKRARAKAAQDVRDKRVHNKIHSPAGRSGWTVIKTRWVDNKKGDENFVFRSCCAGNDFGRADAKLAVEIFLCRTNVPL